MHTDTCSAFHFSVMAQIISTRHSLFLRGIYFSRYQEARSPSVVYLALNHIVVRNVCSNHRQNCLDAYLANRVSDMLFLGKPNVDLQIYISQVLSINWAFGVTVGFMHTCTRQLLFKYAHIPRLAQARPRIPRFYPGPGFIHDRTRIEPGSGLNGSS